LRDWGIQPAGNKIFRDHHRYTESDAHEIETEARNAGADALICTEKDIFNLTDVRWKTFEVMYCRISLRIDREEDFWHAIMAAVESRPKSKKSTPGNGRV
jgi:tetraacyldisaccharide 4'-kinase